MQRGRGVEAGQERFPESFLRAIHEALPGSRTELSSHVAYDDGHIDHDVQIAVFDSAGRVVRFAGWGFDAEATVVE